MLAIKANSTSARPTTRESLLGQPAAGLVLRVRGGGEHDGRQIQLLSRRCILGSAVGCTLRVASTSVAALHCLVLRGARETVVRRLSPDARLNGQLFDDAVLSPGDILGLGPVELEVVASTTEEGRPATSAIEFVQRDLEELQRCCDMLRGERRQWGDELRQSRRQCDSLHTELAAERAVRQLGRDSKQEVAAVRKQIEHERQQWENRRSEAECELAAREQRSAQLAIEQAAQGIALENQQRELAAWQELLTQRDQALAIAEGALETNSMTVKVQAADLAQRSVAIEAQQADLDQRTSGLEAELRQATIQRRILDEAALKVQADRLTVEAERQRLSNEREELAGMRAELAGAGRAAGTLEASSETVECPDPQQKQGTNEQPAETSRRSAAGGKSATRRKERKS